MLFNIYWFDINNSIKGGYEVGLFGFGKKKVVAKDECNCSCECGETAKTSSCCCGGDCREESDTDAGMTTTVIKVLGSGCARCNELEKAVKDALAELGMDTTIQHVTDFPQIAAFGVMTTPALVVDDKVVSYGKVLKKDEVIEILKKQRSDI